MRHSEGRRRNEQTWILETAQLRGGDAFLLPSVPFLLDLSLPSAVHRLSWMLASPGEFKNPDASIPPAKVLILSGMGPGLWDL